MLPVYMNCSVRSREAFMFCQRIARGGQLVSPSRDLTAAGTHLRPNLENILEADTCVCELALEHHDDVVVVLRDLLRPDGRVEVAPGKRLELCNLLVEVGDVLLDDVGEFL